MSGAHQVDPEADAAPEEREPPARRPGAIIGLLHAEMRPDPLNPRKHFDQQGLEDFATELCVEGLLQNLVAREVEPDANGVRFLITAGERRWRAVGIAIARGEWPADRILPVMVKKIGDGQAAIVALLENLSRVDLNHVEQAEHFQHLRLVHHMGTDEIARRIHKTQRFVQQHLQLLELSAEDRQAIAEKRMTVDQARHKLAQQSRGDAGDEAIRLALLGRSPPASADAAPGLLDDEAPLKFELTGKSLPRATIELCQDREVWSGSYMVRTSGPGVAGPLGKHPTREGALAEALEIFQEFGAAERRAGQTKTVRDQAAKFLKWQADIRRGEACRTVDAAAAVEPVERAPDARAVIESARADALKRLVNPPQQGTPASIITVLTGPPSLAYTGAIDLLRAVEQHPRHHSTFYARKTGLGLTAVRRRMRGLADDGLVIDEAFSGCVLTDAGRAALAAIDVASEKPADTPAGDAATIAARERALADVEQRLAMAQAAAAENKPIAGVVAAQHRELWAPAATVAFLEQVLEALK